MGKALSSVGNILGFGGGGPGAGPELNKAPFDISKQAKEYEDRLKQQAAYTEEQNRALSEALAQQARGEGPLAGAAMRQAANRSLAQTLSAAQAMGGSPLAARNIMQARGQSARDLAELGLQERLQAQQALGQQLGRAAETGRADIGAGFGIAKSPQEAMQDYEKTRFQADMARRMAIEQGQREIGGALLGTAAKAGMGYLTGAPVKAAHGGIVPGQPPATDDKINDVIEARVSPGEMIVPATVVQEGPKAIKSFAEALLKTNLQHPVKGYASVVAARKQAKGK